MNETDPSAQLANVSFFLFLIYNTLKFCFSDLLAGRARCSLRPLEHLLTWQNTSVPSIQ
jgi:hypothetical protein